MSLRTKVEILVKVGLEGSLDSGSLAFDRELVEGPLDTMDDMEANTGVLAGGESDREIQLNEVAQGFLLYVESDGDIDVKLEAASNDPIPLVRMADSSGTQIQDLKSYFLGTVQATKLFLSNRDGSNSARYRVLVVGDLVT